MLESKLASRGTFTKMGSLGSKDNSLQLLKMLEEHTCMSVTDWLF